MAEWNNLPAGGIKPMEQKYASPLRFFSITIVGIFVAEVIAMTLIYFAKPEPYWVETLLDASIMIVIVFPLLFFSSFRTLLQQIGERKRSEALLSKVLENLPVGVWITDKYGKIVHGNPASQEIWAGARYVDLEHYSEYKSWWLGSGKRIEPGEWAAAKAIRRGETSLNEEIEIECFDGMHKVILNSAIPIFDEQKVTQGAIIVNQDITRRKRAEEALRLANAYNRSLIEASLDPLVTISIDGKITDVNSATEKVTGFSRKELIGADFSDYFTEPQRAWAGYQQVFLDGSVHDYALEIRHKDGYITPVLYNATVYSDEAGKVIGVFAAARDITERKRYEKELIESKELIETAFNSIDTHIAYMDREFNFIRVNDAYARAAGHPADFFIGRNHFDLYPHEENQVIFQRVVDTGEPYTVFEKPFEYAEFPERGVTYWDWNLQPVMGADNTVDGVVLSLVDVTERKRAEIQLERQNQELRALSNSEHKQRELAEGLAQSVVALNSNLDLEYVLDTILEQLQRSIPYTIAAITQKEDDSVRVVRYTSLKIHPESSKAIEFNNLLMNYPLQKEISTSQQPIYIEDVAKYPDWSHVPGVEWIRSYMAAPLVVGGQFKGMIHLTSDQPGAFSQETVSRLVAFTAPAALAVHNARLYAAETHARQAAETLSAAVQALTQTLDLDRVLETLLEHISTITQSDTTGIALLEGETRLAARAAHGYERWMDLDQVLSISMEANTNPILQELIATRKSVLVSDTATFPGWQDLPGLEPVRSWMVVPLAAGDKVIGVVGLGKIEPDYFTRDHIQWAEALVGQAAMAIQNAWLFEQVRAGHERLKSLSRRLVEVQESERRYIARELHDETSQALTALMFGLRLMEQEVDQPKNLLARLSELKQLTDGVLEDLHRLAMDLRPASLDHLGLVAALEQLVKVVCERYQICVRFKTVGISEEIRLPDDVETALYRIVQEALTNAVRHANAANVDVILELRNGRAIIIVEDDGAGFDTHEIYKSGHLGLLGMQERAQMAGGVLQIESRPGGGTTIVAEVPYVDSYLDRR